jgi:DNA-binding NarL/FixJ family response regulator
MIRILIADDHAVVRKGLKQILLDDFPSCEIEEVSNTEELILKVMKSTFDVVISDLSMPGRSGMEALQHIKQHYPKLPVLILSMHAEEHYALRVLKAGASGYLGKDSASTELVKAVNRVLMGKKYITSTIAEKLASSLDRDSDKLPHEHLSDREFEVLKMLANGKSVSDIAELLTLSITTVSTYRARIMAKMNLKTNADLTLYAVQHKLI